MSSLSEWPEPQAGVLPTKPLLTYLETLNWIAFGHGVDRDVTGRAEIQKTWIYPPSEDGTTSEMLIALREDAGILQPTDRRRLTPPANPTWLIGARAMATKLRETTGQPSITLARWLERDLHDHQRARRYLLGASRAILEALTSGDIIARAKSVFAVLAMNIPVEHFATSGLSLGVNGTLFVGGQTLYTDLCFRSQDVGAIWPQSSIMRNHRGHVESTLPVAPQRVVAELQAGQRRKPGPKTEGHAEMRAGLADLLTARAGKPYDSQKTAWQAVLAKINRQGRGYGRKTFCAACADMLGTKQG